jgi:hypothetical protein
MTSKHTPDRSPITTTLERLAKLKASKPPMKLDPRLELFAQGGIDIYTKRNDEE